MDLNTSFIVKQAINTGILQEDTQASSSKSTELSTSNVNAETRLGRLKPMSASMSGSAAIEYGLIVNNEQEKKE